VSDAYTKFPPPYRGGGGIGGTGPHVVGGTYPGFDVTKMLLDAGLLSISQAIKNDGNFRYGKHISGSWVLFSRGEQARYTIWEISEAEARDMSASDPFTSW
jgi:hypothetical protein